MVITRLGRFPFMPKLMPTRSITPLKSFDLPLVMDTRYGRANAWCTARFTKSDATTTGSHTVPPRYGPAAVLAIEFCWLPPAAVGRVHVNSTLIPDDEGGQLEDVEQAANEARESAHQWTMQIITGGGKIDAQSIEMADDQGVIRLSLPLRLVLN